MPLILVDDLTFLEGPEGLQTAVSNLQHTHSFQVEYRSKCISLKTVANIGRDVLEDGFPCPRYFLLLMLFEIYRLVTALTINGSSSSTAATLVSFIVDRKR